MDGCLAWNLRLSTDLSTVRTLASCCASLTCGLCTSVASGVTRSSARLAYCGLFGVSLIVSWVIREVASPLLKNFSWINTSDNLSKEWFQAQAVLRVSLGNFLFFGVLALIMIGIKDQNDRRDCLHHGGWVAKLVIWVLLVALMFFLPNGVITIYGFLSKFGAGFFLLIQDIKPGSYLVSTVNGFGVIVETIYIALFLKFADQKMRKNTGILAGILNVGILATILLLAQFILYGEMRINVIGFLATCLNIIMYSSPLGVMKTVVRSKSVEYMPFLLSFFFFLNGGVWTLYAVLVRDWFLGVPNGMGWFLGAVQLVIYAIYRNPNPPVQDLEHGDQTEHLLPSSSTPTLY